MRITLHVEPLFVLLQVLVVVVSLGVGKILVVNLHALYLLVLIVHQIWEGLVLLHLIVEIV